jgi:hypothetical protein
MRQHYALLAEVCGHGLSDSSVAVQRVALQTIGTLGEWATDEIHVQAIHSLLPPLFQVTSRNLSNFHALHYCDFCCCRSSRCRNNTPHPLAALAG